MAELTPVSEKNLDRYGSPPLEWNRALQRLDQEYRLQGPIGDDQPHTHWLATVRPDGQPHVVAVGATWLDGAFYHEYSAPSAGPPPWNLYKFTPETIFGVATAEPYGATRWRF